MSPTRGAAVNTKVRPKTCAICGRRVEWRRKWARDWEAVKYCSDRCRGAGLTPLDESLEQAILALLAERGGGGTICPSEASRRVSDPDGDWRGLMQPARNAARRLVGRGLVEILQRGRVVDGSTAKGPIRLRRR